MNGGTATAKLAVEELIKRFHESEHKKAVARRAVTLLILGVIVLYVGVIWSVVMNFRYNRLPEFTTALSAEASSMAPGLVQDVRDMANRLYPHYLSVFQQIFERDWDKIQQEITKQLGLLDTYAQSKWPEVEKGILELVDSTEEVAKEEMAKFVSPGEAEEIALSYDRQIKAKCNDLLGARLKEHVKAAESIGVSLDKMMAAEPDVAPPVDLAKTLGMMLELSGIELQRD